MSRADRIFPLKRTQQILNEKAKRIGLKRNLDKCTRDEQKRFCYMYEAKLPHLFDYKQVVNNMSRHDLNWANTQVQNTLKQKNNGHR